MAQARGFPLSQVGFPASTRRAFYGSIRIWSYRLSTGVTFPQALRYVLSLFVQLVPGKWRKRVCILVEHASAFTQASDLACNPQTLFCCQGTIEQVYYNEHGMSSECACGADVLPVGSNFFIPVAQVRGLQNGGVDKLSILRLVRFFSYIQQDGHAKMSVLSIF
jgi:hypothetical protein